MRSGSGIPVASSLLESRFLGFSVRRLLGSFAIPLGPCFILYTIGFPLLVTLPLFIGGVLAGGAVFLWTPAGQQPLTWTLAMIRHRIGSNVYTWTRPTPGEHDLASTTSQDQWLTQPSPPGESTSASDRDGQPPAESNRADPGTGTGGSVPASDRTPATEPRQKGELAR